MIEYIYGRGAVYIFESLKAKCVKVGLTANTHDIVSRLNDANDIWQERKDRCQIRGSHIVRFGFLIPSQVVHGTECMGGNELPLERV